MASAKFWKINGIKVPQTAAGGYYRQDVLGMSVDEMAEATGLSVEAIMYHEAGRHDVIVHNAYFDLPGYQDWLRAMDVDCARSVVGWQDRNDAAAVVNASRSDALQMSDDEFDAFASAVCCLIAAC